MVRTPADLRSRRLPGELQEEPIGQMADRPGQPLRTESGDGRDGQAQAELPRGPEVVLWPCGG